MGLAAVVFRLRAVSHDPPARWDTQASKGSRMDEAQIAKDLKEQFGGRSVLYPADVAVVLGKTESAVASMKWRGGFPVPVILVGGRHAVSVYAMARWLARGEDESEEDSSGEEKTKPQETVPEAAISFPAVSSKHGGKRDHKSLGKMLIGLRGQREFLAQLDAEIEAEILAAEADESAAEALERESGGGDSAEPQGWI